MSIATILALIGNIQIALPGNAQSPFAWLEAIAPPLLVLSTAYVLKEQVLETIEQRHADERAFQAAFAEWQAATAEPEQHPNWSQFYANALRDTLRRNNARRKEVMDVMTQADWRLAVYREMQADVWYEIPRSERETVDRETGPEKSPALQNKNGSSPKVGVGVGYNAV